MSRAIKLLVLLSGLCTPGLGAEQSFAQSDLLEAGYQAFREERYEDALKEFEKVIAEYTDLSEAFFMISRVYFETPLYNESQARHALEKALELEPENIEYLVARLEQYKVKSWGFLGDRLREARRIDIARKILSLSPDNAYAHEEMGKLHIRDFWRYRNAVMLPSVSYGYAGSLRESDAPDYGERESGSSADFFDGTAIAVELENLQQLDLNEVFLSDQFDVQRLKSMGVNVIDLSQRAEKAYLRAIGHLRKALETDPRRRTVYDELMQIYVLKGEYEDAMNTLNLMYRFFPEDPDLWRYYGVANYQLGNMDAASRSFETAFEFMDEKQRSAYEDLGLFLTKEEKISEETDPVAFRTQYWTSQDPRLLTVYNERRLEHYFRQTYADLLYGSERLNLRGWETERGQILIRYGPPDYDIVLHPQEDGIFSARETLVGAITNSVTESTDTTGLIPRTMEGSQSFGAVYSTARQAFEDMNTYNIWDYGDFRFVFEDPFRNGEYRIYSPSAEEMAGQIDRYVNDYVRITKEIIRETPQIYEYVSPGRQIELPFLVSSFKGEGSQADLIVNYGIPLESSYDPSAQMIDVSAHAGTFLIDEQRKVLVERRRSIYGLPTRQVLSFAEQHLWIDTEQIQAPPGAHQVSLEFETMSGQTVAVQQRKITVPDYDQPMLMLSDMMLAYSVEEVEEEPPSSATEVVRNGLSILPAPWSVYSAQWPIYLYFEVYGLVQNAEGTTQYRVEITLTPNETDRGVRRVFRNLFRRGQEGVSVSYEGSGSESEESLYQILDSSRQPPGLYTLILRVQDQVSGMESERIQDLFLE